jgi:hypothetical protein
MLNAAQLDFSVMKYESGKFFICFLYIKDKHFFLNKEEHIFVKLSKVITNKLTKLSAC